MLLLLFTVWFCYVFFVFFFLTTDLAKMSLSSWSDTNCPRLATNSVEQGGWGCCWLGGEGSAGEGRNGRPCGPSVNVGWKRANPNMILLRIVPSPQATQITIILNLLSFVSFVSFLFFWLLFFHRTRTRDYTIAMTKLYTATTSNVARAIIII